MLTRRQFLKLLTLSGASVVIGGIPVALGPKPTAVYAQGPTPTPTPTSSLPYLKHGRITPADREAAATNYAAKVASAPRSRAPIRPPQPGGIPDYFGPYANYGNSPIIRKFVDSLPGLGPTHTVPGTGANNLGQYMPVAVPDTTTYPGSDYYEIELREYSEKMHSDLPPTRLRGYVQVRNGADVAPIHYMGPLILATKGRPVRVKFSNKLPTGTAGNLFIPTDTTVMGAGMRADGGQYTQNRATIHLHGGDTIWISDGTPNQWTVPAGEAVPVAYQKGVGAQDVPDMPATTAGELTFFWTNNHSARLLFYHDHAYGITRLNVYAGEAAGYLLTDTVEQGLVSSGVVPAEQIPLVIQDKTFVDATQIAAQDPTWCWGTGAIGANGFPTPNTGDLWFPHVYMPNQNPWDTTGANPRGRWDYGPWFWPPFTGIRVGPQPNPYYDPNGTTPWEPPQVPGTPNNSMTMEAFMDTPIVNGTAYPYLQVGQKAYRFRILNACNDRHLNLQLYFAKSNATMWSGTTLLDGNAGEVNMVPATPNTGLPPSWPIDGRTGGVPDPRAAGPAIVEIGTEGGILPAPMVLPNTPIGYDYNRRSITVLNVLNHTLLLGPAERADVIIDFSGIPDGTKLILYNDAPAPLPAFDPRLDYYTGNPNQTSTGGAPSTQPGYGPNTRTIMQFQVSAALGSAPPFDLGKLQAALPAAYAQSQYAPIVPQSYYNDAFNANFPNNAFVRIADTTMTFTPIGSTTPITLGLAPKSIIENFTVDYGRMNAQLGCEVPNTTGLNQTTIPYGYIDPPNEVFTESNPALPVGSPGDGTQIWKITHNGVDTHAIHFHLFDVQLINRVGWDGSLRPPDLNEVGWKDTIRMNPLEDCIVALRAIKPTAPFDIPNSMRLMDVTALAGAAGDYGNLDPAALAIVNSNHMINYGWEYVWHCHILGHEEMDMMRPICVAIAPIAPSNLSATAIGGGGGIRLTWRDNSKNETHWTIQRSQGVGGPWTNLPGMPWQSTTGPAVGGAITFTDTGVTVGQSYYYRVIANNIVGDTTNYGAPPIVGFPNVSADSTPAGPVGPVTAR